MVVKKRFIAGAVCPHCQAQDTIVLIESEGDKHFECIECGHTDKMSDNANSESTSESKESSRQAEQMIQWVEIKDDDSNSSSQG